MKIVRRISIIICKLRWWKKILGVEEVKIVRSGVVEKL